MSKQDFITAFFVFREVKTCSAKHEAMDGHHYYYIVVMRGWETDPDCGENLEKNRYAATLKNNNKKLV